MSVGEWAQWIAAVSGLLGGLGVLFGWLVQARRHNAEDHNADELLAHQELIAALSHQRARIEDAEKRSDRLEERLAEAEAREAECRAKVQKLENQLTNLLWNIEKRFDR